MYPRYIAKFRAESNRAAVDAMKDSRALDYEDENTVVIVCGERDLERVTSLATRAEVLEAMYADHEDHLRILVKPTSLGNDAVCVQWLRHDSEVRDLERQTGAAHWPLCNAHRVAGGLVQAERGLEAARGVHFLQRTYQSEDLVVQGWSEGSPYKAAVWRNGDEAFGWMPVSERPTFGWAALRSRRQQFRPPSVLTAGNGSWIVLE